MQKKVIDEIDKVELPKDLTDFVTVDFEGNIYNTSGIGWIQIMKSKEKGFFIFEDGEFCACNLDEKSVFIFLINKYYENMRDAMLRHNIIEMITSKSFSEKKLQKIKDFIKQD